MQRNVARRPTELARIDKNSNKCCFAELNRHHQWNFFCQIWVEPHYQSLNSVDKLQHVSADELSNVIKKMIRLNLVLTETWHGTEHWTLTPKVFRPPILSETHAIVCFPFITTDPSSHPEVPILLLDLTVGSHPKQMIHLFNFTLANKVSLLFCRKACDCACEVWFSVHCDYGIKPIIA